jgi:tellurite resistance protein TerC
MKYALPDESEGFSFIRTLRHWAVTVLGYFVLVAGIIIAPLPGPGPVVLVPVALTLLATEYVWARRWLKIARHEIGQVERKLGFRSDAA